jgi:hypothetical protein
MKQKIASIKILGEHVARECVSNGAAALVDYQSGRCRVTVKAG